MNIVIYGIDEEKYKCGGCDAAKTMFKDAGLNYEFKRIVKLNLDGFPEHDKAILEDLKTRITVSRLLLPYIFIDGKQVKIGEMKQYLEDAGYEI